MQNRPLVCYSTEHLHCYTESNRISAQRYGCPLRRFTIPMSRLSRLMLQYKLRLSCVSLNIRSWVFFREYRTPVIKSSLYERLDMWNIMSLYQTICYSTGHSHTYNGVSPYTLHIDLMHKLCSAPTSGSFCVTHRDFHGTLGIFVLLDTGRKAVFEWFGVSITAMLTPLLVSLLANVVGSAH